MSTDQRMIYIEEDHIDLDTYQRAYSDKISLTNRRIVFIFPGNPSHHKQGINMFTVKSGGGLGEPAGEIGRAGFPVLSLPTTRMVGRNSKETHDFQIISENAVADLYKALARGYRLMIPVRDHKDKVYFDKPLDGTYNKEPSFWGGVEKNPNKPLAIEYTRHLDHLKLFTDEIYSDGEEIALAHLHTYSPDFAKVYVEARAFTAPVIDLTPLYLQLIIFKDKERLLTNNVAALVAHYLHINIMFLLSEFKQGSINDANLKDLCIEAIDTARPELEEFGLKEILSNLALAILGLGVVYLAACLINKAVTGNFLFFRTDVGKALDVLEENVRQVSAPHK